MHFAALRAWHFKVGIIICFRMGSVIVANTFAWSGWHFFCAGADASYVQYTPLPLAAPHASAWLVGLKFTIAQAVMDAATGAISPCKAAWFLGPQPDAWAIHPHAGLREHDPAMMVIRVRQLSQNGCALFAVELIEQYE